MPEKIFTAPEYQQDGKFIETEYLFSGDEVSGWQIDRQGQPWLALGPGYILVQTRYCGVCATDLARHHLPFPLPQITGHEVVGHYQGQDVALEINASHQLTDQHAEACPYCRAGLDIHCPERLTLGIDRLPGGFSPWVLAPVRAIHPLPDTLEPLAGALIEPFAAALKAVEVSPPLAGDDIAVLGPRRLGMLLIAALAGYRAGQDSHFSITAVVRHPRLTALCKQAGADRVLVLEAGDENPGQQFDIVYDTTGKQAGFALALSMSRRVVHLKSTHGQAVEGLNYLTDMVINEQSLAPYSLESLHKEKQASAGPFNVWLSASIEQALADEIQEALPDVVIFQGEAIEMQTRLQQGLTESVIPQFDAALVTSLAEVDQVLRPDPDQIVSLLKPTGGIFFKAGTDKHHDSALLSALITRHIQLQTSRCGSFKRAISLLENNPKLIELFRDQLIDQLISHVLPLSEMKQAFELAKDSQQSMKIVIRTDGNSE